VSAPTFVVDTRHGRPVIVCHLCGAVSASAHDIKQRYCGRCHLFHAIVADGRALLAAGGTHDCGEWATGRGVCALCGQEM
jgi:hypothetical protein